MANNEEKEEKINTQPEEGKEEETVDTKNEEPKEGSAADEGNEENSPINELQAKLDELQDKYLRTVAEFDNYKKRTLKEKTELILNGGEKTVTAILPVLDDMERAVSNADKANDIKALEEGWELIYKKLQQTLETLGIKKIETEGEDFDVDYHEAVAMVPGMGDDKKGKVIDCMQTGYTLNDKVIRHAKVAVGQ
jgi:molecular chaperone GrpE